MAADPLTISTVDELFNVDFSDLDDDPFADKPTTNEVRDDKVTLSPRPGLKRKPDDKENDELGLDEEVKITKKRKPVVKLDENRLLSEPGIPKLRALARSGQLSKKLRIKGKGHEFSDAARLLNHFQLWLDNLYPRAKFADALQLVEKAGHTKRMHIVRTEWINEGKPGYKKYEDQALDLELPEPDLFGAASAGSDSRAPGNPVQSDSLLDSGLDDDALFIPDASRSSLVDDSNQPEDDELDALLAAQDDAPSISRNLQSLRREEESEGEDDLDALLAEQDTRRPHQSASAQPAPISRPVEDDLDDLDALLAEQEDQETSHPLDFRTGGPPKDREQGHNAVAQSSENSEDEGDLEALLTQRRASVKSASRDPSQSLPTPQPTSSPAKSSDITPKASQLNNVNNTNMESTPLFSSSPIPNNPEDLDFDDLDALMASQEEKTKARIVEAPSTPKTTKSKKVVEIDEDDEEDFLGSPVPNDESQ